MAYKFYSGRASDGCRVLSTALGVRRLKRDNSLYRPRRGDVIFNWGCSVLPDFGEASIINSATAVAIASNKLRFFQSIGDEARTVPWTTESRVAEQWSTEGHKIVCRSSLTGHSGHGIIIVEPEDEELPLVPLYTQYVKKQAEYRVHVVGGRVIDVQRKIRDPNREPVDWHVRSHQNGFIFVRDNVVLPPDAEAQALSAMRGSGLDFGAVDVIVKRDGTAFVLEVNTAPGLTGQTVTNYAEAFRQEFMN